jgi:glycosyltransferase involved in cell wall biosynthesis
MQKVKERFSQGFEVIVSHPARQGFVYQVPLAIQRQGIPVKLLTGLYYKPDQFPYSMVKYLPCSKRAAVVRQLEKRRLEELDPESVISLGGPWLEIAFRPLSFSREWLRMHDSLAGRWVCRFPLPPKRVLLHCFDGSARNTMRAAKQKGIITVYEITLPAIAAVFFEAEGKSLGFLEGKRQIWWGSKSWMTRLVEEYKAADYLVAQSRITVDYLLQLGIVPSRIILLPLGVDNIRFHPDHTGEGNRPFRALFVGQLGIRKGLHHLDAWKQLDLGNAELILAGTVNKREFGVEVLERYRGATCRRLGFVDEELPKVYQSSDIFILPSLAEGASLVMHEAMASGLPCIVSTNVGCTLRNGVEGFVISVGDVKALKDRILRLYSTPRLRQAMGMAARARAEKLTWQEYGRRLALMYQIILSNERKSATDILDMTEL